MHLRIPQIVPILLLSFSTVLSGMIGCASNSELLPSQHLASAYSDDASSDIAQPYDVQIVQETNDGELLSVVFQVVASSRAIRERRGDRLTVHLSLFSDGQQVSQIKQPIEQLVDLSTLEPVTSADISEIIDKQLLIQAEIPSETISDYQVRLDWGVQEKEREQYLLRSVEVQKGLGVCTSLEGEEDSNAACAVPYELTLELFNPYPQPIGNITVNTWFALSEVGNTNGISAPEKVQVGRVLLSGVELLPSAAVSVVVDLTKPLPVELEKQGYRPQIKVQGFEFIGSQR